MSDNRWQQVEDIFHRAVELAPEARSAFLAEVCGADHFLRCEVESLLDHDSEDGDTFAGPVGDEAPQTIAHYRISGKVGEGGMGAVYRAMDTKLGREVAIKVLPASFAEDADRIGRFTREAKVLASLNHPNIAQIYGIEERALVMELVPGETLKAPLPPETALNYARQIAEALEAAHEKGIVHRDLKPGNIKVKPDGTVKVLDFGLAKTVETPSGDPQSSPTLTTAPTQAGMLMGTAAYMSPEQAVGRPVDKRADIWSFGVVLWELLTGHRLFEGETISHTLAAVLRGPIDFDKLPRETPRAIRALLRRCLERNPKNRLRDIGEARIAIEAALAGEPLAAEGVPEPGGGRRLWLAWSVAAVLALGLAAFAFLHLREKPLAPAVPVRFQIPTSDPWSLVVSPDGRKLAYIGGDRLRVRSLESGESRDLTADESGGALFWSPDSRFIGYLAQDKLKKIEANGGPPQTVTDYRGVWGCGAWNQDDVIVFGDRQIGLFRVPASGGVSVQITAVDPARHETGHYGPSFLPDGRHFVYIRASSDEGKSAIYLGSVDAKPEQQSFKPLVASDSQPVYAPSADPATGYLLFTQGVTLMAQPFDNRRLELKGKAAPVADQVKNDMGGATFVSFSASANVLVFPQRNASTGQQVTWYDREGKVMGTVGEPAFYARGYVGLSPDGTRLALSKNRRGADSGNIWLLDLSRGGASTRFTFGHLIDVNPLWSPDGSRIVFCSNRDGPYDLYQKPANGAKDEEPLLKSSENKHALSWSRDGRFLLYTVVHPKKKRKMDVWVLPMKGEKKPIPFLVTEFNEHEARFSPDGHWVAYTSDESGQDQVYVRSFSMNSAGTAVEAGGKWPISDGVGFDPHWRGDGRELYYQSLDGRLHAVEIATSPVFRAGKPRPLGVSTQRAWDVTADGKRFLTLVAKSGPHLPSTVVLNWQAGLKK